jgi:hypothetical protein
MPPKKKSKTNWAAFLQTLMAAVAGGAATSVVDYASSTGEVDGVRLGKVAAIGAAVGVVGLYTKKK